ncbi:MAG: hypothetical protein WBA58_08480 [Giesbergeria sp.]
MQLDENTLDMQLGQSDHGLSARRLWEYTELGQVNVFGQAISARPELNDAATFIDIVRFEGDAFTLAGVTLAELWAGRIPADSSLHGDAILIDLTQAQDVADFVFAVASHLDLCSHRQAVRNQHHHFFPSANVEDVFGVPLLHSSMQRLLRSLGKSKAGAAQWRKTIENFHKKGLRVEEFDRSNLTHELAALGDDGGQISAWELASLCDFSALRLSVIPVISNAQRQLRFSTAPERVLKRTNKVPKAQTGQTRTVTGFDPVLGYRIEQVEHQTLWGPESHWQAVTHDGQVIRNGMEQSLFPARETAAELAASHARLNFPKRVALGHFGSYAWTGGEAYREWLITLPYYPASFLSGHFEIRNVLVHVRCDVRDGAAGERVLLLHEVQSDWAQSARRAIACGEMDPDDDGCPPFLKEWPALAMKLVLLHAAHQGLDAVAWTRGAHQVFRYKGLGARGLHELYDRTLPREVNRILKPFGCVCETLGVFVPTNFSIKQTENGYEVVSPEGELLGAAPTLEAARQFVPDQGHELLYEVHGVRLFDAVCKALLEQGLSAWG